ncbi:MAG: hypothetical protein KKE12_05635, partial [Proteobacteria bacterium]|nr:hypothetical protein [Pseudomonadota bacterium]
EFSTQIKVALMTRLGIPLVRIAQRLNIHRETIAKYAQKNDELFNKIYQDFKAGSCIPDMAQKYFVPQALVWSVILQEKKDQERFKALNWGLRTWDHWYFNDVDHRFGDPWPGRIPAQLVAHTLFYFTQEMEDHSFTGLSPFNGKVYWKYGKQNAGKKNPGYCQKNIDHWKTKYPSQTDIVKHALNTKENFIKSVQRISHFWIFF